MRVETTLASAADGSADPRRPAGHTRRDGHLPACGADESDQPARRRWPERPSPEDDPDSRR